MNHLDDKKQLWKRIVESPHRNKKSEILIQRSKIRKDEKSISKSESIYFVDLSMVYGQVYCDYISYMKSSK